jgi:hypothetical protein
VTLKCFGNRVSDNLLMIWKRALSYRKREWRFEDYPITVRRQSLDGVPEDAAHEARYWARIHGWLIDETAPTESEALGKLRERYATRKKMRIDEGESVPRPGTKVPITFASQERVYADKELADDFIQRVLRHEWAFISDESTLWDFTSDETIKEFQDRILLLYGVAVYDIEDGNLATVLERIRERPA